MSSVEVDLGFLEEADPWRLRSPQFPSKVGGKPAWLSQTGLPSVAELECQKCRLPMAFLLQVYAPVSGLDRCFHRTLFLFCCKTPECYTRVFRSQLPRRNDFYSFDPPPEDEPPSDDDPKQSVLPSSGVKLCWVCGCPGNKACARCHTVTYCGKHHQTLHWKNTHKRECCSQEAAVATASSFLFPESELVTEPEEEQREREEEKQEAQRSDDCPSLAEGLAESELEEMALHETEDSKVFQRFKRRIATEPHQVLRYTRGGSPLWVSSQLIPSEQDIPPCTCGARRTFEFQVMPQLLNSLRVDSTGASVDWGTLAVFTCADSCNHDDQYCTEFIWKQDFSSDQHSLNKKP
ncbi:programmed cell death protein 2 isoform X2 [Synchiropus splendidus]|uniref:programmed cell death protein 2 isoform X2 n=1 Tax=Synchiropus splendidus TaxID=270530 RepID=UPI00237E832E|nr:programmed cell death protein 2 isoform X2 [Synchiropus splendidus]